MKGLSLEINKDTLRSPKVRLILCVLAAVLAVLCINGNLTGRSFERGDMTPVTAVFKDCIHRPNAEITSVNANDIYLVFEGGDRFYIHANCADDELTQRLFRLDAGTEVEMLVDISAGNITELVIDGEEWLSFETVQQKMNSLEVVLDWVGYGMIAAAAVLAVSLVPVLIRLIRKEEV